MSKTPPEPHLVIRRTPDMEYRIVEVRQRFEVDEWILHTKLFPAYLEKMARETSKLAIRNNALRNWQVVDEPLKVDKSDLQVSLDIFRALDIPSAQDSTLLLNFYGKVAYVVIMHFKVPQQRIEVLESHELTQAEGYGPDPRKPERVSL